jgi:DNA-directed RNA polymerase specialized sigma24 family protein
MTDLNSQIVENMGIALYWAGRCAPGNEDVRQDAMEGLVWGMQRTGCPKKSVGYIREKIRRGLLRASKHNPQIFSGSEIKASYALDGPVNTIDVGDLERLLSRLSSSDRSKVYLKGLGYTNQEIGDMYGITAQAISQRIRDIRKQFIEFKPE